MENNPQKDLTYFKDEVVREKGFDHWDLWTAQSDGFHAVELHEAWQRYCDYLVQQAKHAGFIEGRKAQKHVCAEHAKVWEDHFRGRVNYYVDKDSIINSPDAESPYEPREKGGEDE